MGVGALYSYYNISSHDWLVSRERYGKAIAYVTVMITIVQSPQIGRHLSSIMSFYFVFK